MIYGFKDTQSMDLTDKDKNKIDKERNVMIFCIPNG